MCSCDTPISDNGQSIRNEDEGTERLMMAGCEHLLQSPFSIKRDRPCQKYPGGDILGLVVIKLSNHASQVR
jgi:hypothetical protein